MGDMNTANYNAHNSAPSTPTDQGSRIRDMDVAPPVRPKQHRLTRPDAAAGAASSADAENLAREELEAALDAVLQEELDHEQAVDKDDEEMAAAQAGTVLAFNVAAVGFGAHAAPSYASVVRELALSDAPLPVYLQSAVVTMSPERSDWCNEQGADGAHAATSADGALAYDPKLWAEFSGSERAREEAGGASPASGAN